MASTAAGDIWTQTSCPCSYSVTPNHDKPSRLARHHGPGPRMYQSKFAMLSHMVNACPHARQAACTNAASAIQWTMEPSLARRPIRMMAGQVSNLLYIPALVLAKGMNNLQIICFPLGLHPQHILIQILDAIVWLYALLASLRPYPL